MVRGAGQAVNFGRQGPAAVQVRQHDADGSDARDTLVRVDDVDAGAEDGLEDLLVLGRGLEPRKLVLACLGKVVTELLALGDERVAFAVAADAMYGAGRVYVNYTGEASENTVRAAYAPDTYRRLRQVKDRCDPSNLFRFNQNIAPSETS